AAVDLMLFTGDCASCLLHGCQYRLNVEGLDRVQVDQLDTDTLTREVSLGFDGGPDEVTACEDGDVLALDHLVGFADGERSVGRGKDWPAWSSKPQISWAGMVA